MMKKIFNKKISRDKKLIYGLVGLVSVSLLSLLVYNLIPAKLITDPIDLLSVISQGATKSMPSGNTELQGAVSEDLAMPYMYREDGYYEDMYTFTAGPAIAKCNSYSYYDLLPGESVTNISKSYQGDDVYAAEYKTIYNGDILDHYSLSNFDGNYTYIGGAYAVVNREPNDIRILGGAEQLPAVDYVEEANNSGVALPAEVEIEKVNNYGMFGEDAELIGEVELNGVQTYLIEYPSAGYCNTVNEVFDEIAVSSTDELFENDLMIRVWVTVDDYEYVQQETYYESISDSNLISKETFINDYQDVDYFDVRLEFEFTYPVRVREIKYPEIEDENMFALETARDNGISLFEFPSAQLQYIYSDQQYVGENTEYYYDRDFYPNTPRGDDAYNEAIEMENKYPSTLLSTNYDGDDNYYSVNYYESTLSDVLNSSMIYGDCVDSFIKIDDVNKTVCIIEESEPMQTEPSYPGDVSSSSTGNASVQIYEDGYEVQEIDPDDISLDEPIDREWKSYQYIFQYGEFVVHINSNVEITTLTTVNLQSTTVFQNLYDAIEQSRSDMDEDYMDKPMPL